MSIDRPIELRTHPDEGALALAAAACVAEHAARAVAERGRFSIALAGGGTPRAAYLLLAGAWRDRVPWVATDVWFGDERCVPPDHEASNWRMAREALLAHVPVVAASVHRIPGELSSHAAAGVYDGELRHAFGAPADDAPTFDLVLLGVGADGHTASLFPGSAALAVTDRWAVPAESPDPARPWPRVTLTLPAIRNADTVVVLAAGEAKRAIVQGMADGTAGARGWPVWRARGRARTLWLVDQAAGAP